MASKKISQLNQIAEIDDLDILPIVDESSNETKRVTIAQLKAAIDIDTKAVWGQLTGYITDQEDLMALFDEKASVVDLSNHISDYNNPHNVTKGQIGLGNVTNDSQVKRSEMGAINGVATLGADQKIPTSQLPALAVTDTFVVLNQSEMLALSAQRGDVAIRIDLNKSFILAVDDASILANWKELLTPTDSVLSVNGQTGAVVLTTTNIAEGSNLYFTNARAITATAATYIPYTGATANIDLGIRTLTTLGLITAGSFKFEKGTFDLTLAAATITSSNKTITFPNVSGTITTGTGVINAFGIWTGTNQISYNSQYYYNSSIYALSMGGYANGYFSAAIGYGSYTTDYFAIAIGSSYTYGQYSVVIGANNYLYSSFTVAIGIYQNITGYYSSAIGGSSNTINAQNASALGSNNTFIYGRYSSVIASSNINVNASYATALSLNQNPSAMNTSVLDVAGMVAYGSYQGQPQRYAGSIVFGADTYDSNPIELRMDSGDYNYDYLWIRTGDTWGVTGYILGVRKDTGEVSRHQIDFVAENTSGSVALIYSNIVTQIDESYARNVTISTNGPTIAIYVQGQYGAEVNWIGHLKFERMTGTPGGSGSGSGSGPASGPVS